MPGHVRVVVERSRLVCAELDDRLAAGWDSPGQAVCVDGEAVGHVRAFDRELDQIVLGDLEAIGREAIIPRGDRELTPVRRLVLVGGSGKKAGRATGKETGAGPEKDQSESPPRQRQTASLDALGGGAV